MNILLKRIIKKVIYSIFKTKYPPGHYHSPAVSRKEIFFREKNIFKVSRDLMGVDLKESAQMQLLNEMQGKFYHQLPFGEQPSQGLRYYFNNSYYSYSDAIFLYLVIRYFCPRKIIEVGSGYSSAAILDINNLFFANKIQCTFIEPYPKRLLSLLQGQDKMSHEIIVDCVQDVDAELFSRLNENDILFVDSSHISKTGSDVNWIFFNILPRLKPGVVIHFHDIFYPFEYPKQWVLDGNSWNECYLLRAFLSYNPNFEIVLFNTFLEYFHKEWFRNHMPLCLQNEGGSIWIKKV